MRNGIKILLIVVIVMGGIIPILTISSLGIIPQDNLIQSSDLANPTQTPLKISLNESMEMRNP